MSITRKLSTFLALMAMLDSHLGLLAAPLQLGQRSFATSCANEQ